MLVSSVVKRPATAGSCLFFAILVTAIFIVSASLTSKYPNEDIYVGAAWVFTLSLIISSPVLVPLIRKKLR